MSGPAGKGLIDVHPVLGTDFLSQCPTKCGLLEVSNLRNA